LGLGIGEDFKIPSPQSLIPIFYCGIIVTATLQPLNPFFVRMRLRKKGIKIKSWGVKEEKGNFAEKNYRNKRPPSNT
jgi:hypothetical protein